MKLDQTRGIMLGLAVGDALGRPVEFRSQQEITREYGELTEMEGHGTWNQPAGTITDDTEQAMAIARSLVEQEGFNPEDIADRFVAWFESDPFDVGNMTSHALLNLQNGLSWDKAGEEVWDRSQEGKNAGNGSVMRTPPLSIPFVNDPDRLVEVSRQTSLITHADPRCTYGAAILNLTIAGLLNDIDAPLESALDFVGNDAPAEIRDSLKPLAKGRSPKKLQTSGYVVHTLQTALHDGLFAENAEDAIVTAVNRGIDTDTVGAITGSIVGARFGASDLPNPWISTIREKEELSDLAEKLTEMAY